MKTFLLFTFAISSLAQVELSGVKTTPGTSADFSQASTTAPFKTVTNAQVGSQACAKIGNVILTSDGGYIYYCTIVGSPGTWALLPVAAGSVINAIATLSGCTTAGNVWSPASNSCVAAGTSGSSCTYRGYWDSSISYPVGTDSCSTVFYGSDGKTYQSLATSTNVIPGTDTTKWTPVGVLISPSWGGVYDSSQTYPPGRIVYSNPNSYYSLITVPPGNTPPSLYSFPSGNTYWGPIASGAGTATPALTTSISPTSRTLIQGGSTTYVATFTATALSAVITPTVTGLPSGVSYTVSPTTVATTGGTATYTLSATGTATIATSTITFTGTSGSTTGSTNATLITDYPATVFTLSNSGLITTPYSITGGLDWKIFAASTSLHKNVTSQIDDIVVTGSGDTGAYFLSDGSNSLSYTDASTTSGSSASARYNAGTPQVFSSKVTLPADMLAHHIEAYLAMYTPGGASTGPTVAVKAHSSDTSLTDPTTINDSVASYSGGMKKFVITVKATVASSTVTVSFDTTNMSAYNILFHGVKLVD